MGNYIYSKFAAVNERAENVGVADSGDDDEDDFARPRRAKKRKVMFSCGIGGGSSGLNHHHHNNEESPSSPYATSSTSRSSSNISSFYLADLFSSTASDVEQRLSIRDKITPRRLFAHYQPYSSSSSSRSNANSNINHQLNDSTASSDDANISIGSGGSSQLLLTPSKKRMKSTSAYIYKTLFVDGEGSDVTVCALGHSWRLHKLYLCQSPYFAAMFNGSGNGNVNDGAAVAKWRESNQSHIDMHIPDERVSVKALHTAFGSFYREHIELVPAETVAVLACASLFGLDGLIGQCEAVMAESLGAESVLVFYEVAQTYALRSLADACFDWLCENMMRNEDIRLGDIEQTLFERIIASEQFLIMQVETDLYSLCKKWLFYQMSDAKQQQQQQQQQSQHQPISKLINEFFCNYIKEATATQATHESNEGATQKPPALLDMAELVQYASVFRRVRWQHVITDYASLKLVYAERIVPVSWLDAYYATNWLQLIYMDQEKLSHEFECTPEAFDANCMRFGRVLADADDVVSWRWVGFNYGLDCIVTHANRVISIKRNAVSAASSAASPFKGLLSCKRLQRVYCSLRVVELDKHGKRVWHKRTPPAADGIKCLDFTKTTGEERHVLMQVDESAGYPLLLNLRILAAPSNLTPHHTTSHTTSQAQAIPGVSGAANSSSNQ